MRIVVCVFVRVLPVSHFGVTLGSLWNQLAPKVASPRSLRDTSWRPGASGDLHRQDVQKPKRYSQAYPRRPPGSWGLGVLGVLGDSWGSWRVLGVAGVPGGSWGFLGVPAGVLWQAQKGQKSHMDHKGKNSLDSEFQWMAYRSFRSEKGSCPLVGFIITLEVHIWNGCTLVLYVFLWRVFVACFCRVLYAFVCVFVCLLLCLFCVCVSLWGQSWPQKPLHYEFLPPENPYIMNFCSPKTLTL